MRRILASVGGERHLRSPRAASFHPLSVGLYDAYDGNIISALLCDARAFRAPLPAPSTAPAPAGEEDPPTSMALFSKPPAKKPEPAGAERGNAAVRRVEPRPRAVRARGRESRRPKAAGAADRRQVDPGGDITVTGASLDRMVAAGAAGVRGRAGQSRPVRGARECRAALRERPGASRRARCSSRACRPTTTRSFRRSRGSRCSTCCSAPATAPRSTSSRCSTSCSSSARRRRGRRRRSRSPAPRVASGGYIGLTGKLTAASATQLEGLQARDGEAARAGAARSRCR